MSMTIQDVPISVGSSGALDMSVGVAATIMYRYQIPADASRALITVSAGDLYAIGGLFQFATASGTLEVDLTKRRSVPEILHERTGAVAFIGPGVEFSPSATSPSAVRSYSLANVAAAVPGTLFALDDANAGISLAGVDGLRFTLKAASGLITAVDGLWWVFDPVADTWAPTDQNASLTHAGALALGSGEWAAPTGVGRAYFQPTVITGGVGPYSLILRAG